MKTSLQLLPRKPFYQQSLMKNIKTTAKQRKIFLLRCANLNDLKVGNITFKCGEGGDGSHDDV